MRIFFIGNVSFSRSMLKVLLSLENIEIVGLATKSKSNFNSDHDDLSDLAENQYFTSKYIKDINAPHIVEWISNLKPDVIYCMGWSSLIKKELISVPTMGVIGYHPTELPYNRGRHPLIWTLVLGLKSTASTFFKMDEGADTGDIASQVIVEVTESDTAKTLYDKLTRTAKKQLIELTKQLKNNTVNWLKQPTNETNYWRKRSQKDGEINFSCSTKVIYNLVRAITKPYIGAHLMFNGQEIKVWSTSFGPNQKGNHEPGKVLETDKKGNILVKTADGSIWIHEHEFFVLPEKNSYII
jgi:methionyl-tRNA formyltransferase